MGSEAGPQGGALEPVNDSIIGPHARGGGVRPWELLALLGILILHALALRLYYVPTSGGTDANAYHVASRMVQEHGRFHQVPADTFTFMGKMWVVNERGEFYPKYPPVYPTVLGVVMKAFGTQAGFLVNPICALLAVIGMFVAARVFLPGWAALLAAWTVSISPVLNSLVVDQVSHATSFAIQTWAFALFFLGEYAGVQIQTRQDCISRALRHAAVVGS